MTKAKKRRATKTGGGGGGLLDRRACLGEDSYSGDEDHGLWVTLPAGVRPVMQRAMDVMDSLTADFSGVSLSVTSDSGKIEELHDTLRTVRELRNLAEDGFAGDVDELGLSMASLTVEEKKETAEKKRVVSAVFDRVHELAYGKLLACQSVALASGARQELRDFLRATQTSLESRNHNGGGGSGGDGDDEDKERAALPAFIRSGRLSDIQSGDAEEGNRFTDLLLYVQFCLRTRDLRRHDDRVFSRVFNSNGKPTAAWKDAGDITQFIHSVCRKEINPRMWAIVAQPSDPVSAAVRYFTTSNDPEFPALERDKSVFSFDNGVYLAATNEFLSYDDPASEFNTSHPMYRGETVPAKHFEARFPVEQHAATVDDMMAWKDIPTPHVESMFTYQSIPEPAIRMVYVTVGRIMHHVARYDNYGYVGMIVGAAGTGKSTFCMHLTKLWEADDVGVLSNNCERQFALYPFMNKFLFVAPEVKSDFKLDQAEWQGITTGDPMSCAVKFKPARAIRWTTPGFFAGNQIPDWVDHGGSVLRRLLIWRFDKRVGVENGNLPAQLEAELPMFILKCAVAYLQTLRDEGNAAMWTWVDGPEKNGYFWEQRRRLTAQLNPLESFIHDKLVKDSAAMMPFDEFKRSLRDFCKENGFDSYRMAGDTFTTIFSDHGFVKGPRAYRGDTSQARMIDCVTGCRMRTEQDNVAAAALTTANEDVDAADDEYAQDSCDES